MSDLNDFLREKLRVPTMTAHDAPDGGDRQLQDAANELADEASDVPYSPPLPVPIASPEELSDVRRQPSSEVWLINPPATLPGLGTLVGGGASEKGSQFAVNSIRVDNLTSQWVYFPEIGAWCPPFWFGRVMRYDGSKVQRVRFETPGGITALTVSATQICRVVFSNAWWEEVDGESAIGNLGGGTTGAQAFTFLADNADAQAVNATAVDLLTLARIEGFNGATWDRLRTMPAAGAPGNVGVLAVGVAATDGTNLVAVRAENVLGDAVANSIALETAANLKGFNGATWDRLRTAKVFKPFGVLSIGASSTQTVWTPAAGLKPRMLGFMVNLSSVSAGPGIVTFFDNTTTGAVLAGTGWMSVPSSLNSSQVHQIRLDNGPIVATSSNVILAWSSNAITIAGMVFGTEE